MRSTPDRNISSFNIDAVRVVFLFERGSAGRSELVALQSNQMITTGEGTWPNSWYSWSGGLCQHQGVDAVGSVCPPVLGGSLVPEGLGVQVGSSGADPTS